MQKNCSKVRKISLIISLFVFCSIIFVGGAASAAYYDNSSGDSWETAYIISSAEDLKLLRNRAYTESSGKYYKLNADIDLTSETDWQGIDSFAGYFDGQNHTISINSQYNTVMAGLFEYVSSSNDQVAIKNLNVVGTVKADCAGTIVHYLESGIVENCSFSGTITLIGDTAVYGAGGLVAHLIGGIVRNCRVSADISGESYAGGIAGEMTSGYIQNCTANVNILSGSYKGGIVGTVTSDSLSANLSGNTWPNTYPQVGNVSSTSNNTPPTTSQDVSSGLEIAVVSVPPYLSDEVIARLARNISVDPSQIILLTSADFDPSDPPDPTESMKQTARKDGYQLAAKLNTIHVSKDGYYVFMVTVSDDLVGTSVKDFRLYGAEPSDFAASHLRASRFRASVFGLMPIINGITGALEVSDFLGLQLDTLPKQFLATMFMSASTSMTVYIAKILLMLLAGCSTVTGVSAISSVILLGIFAVKFFRKR